MNTMVREEKRNRTMTTSRVENEMCERVDVR